MTVSYDVFTEAFLNKITEYRLPRMDDDIRQAVVDGYMKRACSQFAEYCRYDLYKTNEDERTFDLDGATDGELTEIVDIVSEGMLLQWLKPYMYMQKNLETLLVTNDHSFHSQAELVNRVRGVYEMCERAFTRRMRDYTYRHGDLTDLHL